MTTLTTPPLLPLPFASSGAKNSIPTASASPLASLTDGFPAVTMQPISSGGVPPAGMDFNGILFWITQFQSWVNGGGRFKFDSVFAAAIGGYPVGVVLQLNDNVSEVVCVTTNNTNDPNSSMTGWAPYGGVAAGIGNYVADAGSVNNIVAIQSPAISSYKNGYWIIFKALNTNTGAMTINTGGGAVSLKRNDGAALVSGDIVAGTVYRAVYDSSDVGFRIIDAVTSQVSGALFTVQHNVVGSRAKATTYTNSTGKPMYVEVTGTTSGPNSNLFLNVNGIVVSSYGQVGSGASISVSGMVPPGATYSITDSVYAVSVSTWLETY